MKTKLILAILLLLALSGYIMLVDNPNIAFEVVVNNTDMCSFNHTSGKCNGERNSSINYYANNSAIQIFLKAHANAVAQNATIQLYINDTEVEHVSGRPLGSAEDNWKSITAIIPKGAKYKAVFDNFHHYEWREYPIISGRNGTLSINQTIINQGSGGGVSFNGNPVNLNGSNLFNGTISNYSTLSFVNDTFCKLSGCNMTGNINMGTNNVINSTYINVSRTVFISNRTEGAIFDTTNSDIEIESWKNTVIRTVATGAGVNSFGANSAGGNLTNPTAIGKNQIIFNFFGAGYDGTNWSGGRVAIRLYADDTWNTTSQPTRIEFFTTPVGSTTLPSPRFIIWNNGSVQISSLAGTGNAYTCVDNTGKLYRGNPGC